MPAVPHIETHFRSSEVVRDIVIGMADGLTVPFALAAGMTGALAANPHATALVVTAGVAEIAAGSIAMGLGGYLAGKTDSQHYDSERQREIRETQELPEQEEEEVAQIFRHFGLQEPHLTPVVEAIRSDSKRWVDFMMRFELGLEAPDPGRARRSAVTIGASYVLGGLIPLSPYMILNHVVSGLWFSAGITGLALLIFGGVKARFTGIHPLRGGLQTVFTGGLAAAAAFAIARLVG